MRLVPMEAYRYPRRSRRRVDARLVWQPVDGPRLVALDAKAIRNTLPWRLLRMTRTSLNLLKNVGEVASQIL